MSYLFAAISVKVNCDDVETAGAILYIILSKEIAGGFNHAGFLGKSDGRFCGCEGFIGPGFYLDKNNSAIGIGHDQVEFAGFTGKIFGKGL